MTKSRVFYHVTMQPHRRLPALYAEVEALVVELLDEFTRHSQFSVRAVGVVPTYIRQQKKHHGLE